MPSKEVTSSSSPARSVGRSGVGPRGAGLPSPQAISPVQEMLLEAERSGAMPAGNLRPLDDLFERGRRELRAASARSSAATTALQPSSRCDLEQQLQEWRREADAKKRKGNTGLLVPPRMSLEKSIEHSGRRLPDSLATRQEQEPRLASFSSGSARDREARQAEALIRDDNSRGVGHFDGLGSTGRLGLASAASAPSLPTTNTLRERELFTPPRPQRQSVSPLSVVWPSGDPLAHSPSSRVSEPSGANASQQEVAALRRYLAAVQREISDRDRQLEDLAEQERLLEEFDGEEDAVEGGAEVEEWLRSEEEQVKELQAALTEADLRIRESEEQLQLGQAHQQGTASSSAVAVRASEAPSLASTAPTGPTSVEQVWQDRAKALERDIRCEAAQALELQDRIHWLRTQLWRQPTPEDERVLAIKDLFEQIQERVKELSKSNAEAAAAENGML